MQRILPHRKSLVLPLPVLSQLARSITPQRTGARALTTSSSPATANPTSTTSNARNSFQDHRSPTSSSSSSSQEAKAGDQTAQRQSPEKATRPAQTVLMSDEEVRQKLEEMSGDGGVAGLELEGGKPVAMKRGVRENMFRLI